MTAGILPGKRYDRQYKQTKNASKNVAWNVGNFEAMTISVIGREKETGTLKRCFRLVVPTKKLGSLGNKDGNYL